MTLTLFVAVNYPSLKDLGLSLAQPPMTLDTLDTRYVAVAETYGLLTEALQAET